MSRTIAHTDASQQTTPPNSGKSPRTFRATARLARKARFLSPVSAVFIALSIGWDAHEAGLRDSVAADAFITLAERLAIDSTQLPSLMQSKVDALEKWRDESGAARNDDPKQAAEKKEIAARKMPKRAARSPVVVERKSPGLQSDEANSVLADFDQNAARSVQLAIRRTGISSDYLINTAHLETNLDPGAQSRTSTAAGLFQMTDSTWLSLIRNYGSRYGWKAFGEQVNCSARSSGIADTATKQAALDLRFDAMTSTFLAAELARENQEALKKALARDVSDPELYVAHFLGLAGSVRILRSLETSPDAFAASMFPAAARANKPLFYDDASRKLKVKQFYAELDERWRNSVRQLSANAGTKRNEDAS